jgi:cation diffusion facilitator CzcD-associated flavoprotein CzcO
VTGITDVLIIGAGPAGASTDHRPAHPDLRAVLVRPDGHTAWLSTDAGHPADGLRPALTHWHGSRR